MARRERPELLNGWNYIDEVPPPNGRQVLVTNNPVALDAHGGMSHIWISFVIKADKKTDGKWVGFTDSDRKIIDLIAWHPMPEPPCLPPNAPFARLKEQQQ